MTGYELSRNFWNWAFENPEKNNPTLCALYFYIVEVDNRLGWKEKFTITSRECCEAIGISDYKTYKKNFDKLVEYEFIVILKKSFNQHQANIVALGKNTKAHTKALDKALTIASLEQMQEQTPSHIPHTKTNNQGTNNQETLNEENGLQPAPPNEYKNIFFKNIKIECVESVDREYYEIAKGFFDLFYSNMQSSGIAPTSLDKAKCETVISPIRLMLQKGECTKDDLRTLYSFLEKDEFWKPNIRSTATLRAKRETLLLHAKTKAAGVHSRVTSVQKCEKLKESVLTGFEIANAEFKRDNRRGRLAD
jgi:hypothetical protein